MVKGLANKMQLNMYKAIKGRLLTLEELTRLGVPESKLRFMSERSRDIYSFIFPM